MQIVFAISCSYIFCITIILVWRANFTALQKTLLDSDDDSIKKARRRLRDMAVFLALLGFAAVASIGFFVEDLRNSRIDIPINDYINQLE